MACSNAGYPTFGVEFGQECWCGATLGTTTAASFPCNVICTGNTADSFCGGSNAIQVYTTTITSVVNVVNQLGDYRNRLHTYYGCFQDSISARTFDIQITNLPASAIMGPTVCLNACTNKGYIYSGTQYGTECWCRTADPVGTVPKLAASACNMLCQPTSPPTGNFFCGGSNALTVYKFANQRARQLALYSYYILDSPIATKVTYLGCYPDTGTPPAANSYPLLTSLRPLLGYFEAVPSATMTVEVCAAICTKYGWTRVGVVPTGCYCDNTIRNNVAAAADGTKCFNACGGSTIQSCGNTIDTGYLSVYQLDTVNPSPQPGTSVTTSTTGFSYVGCYVDSTSSRVLPYRVGRSASTTMTPIVCGDLCAVQGYTKSGVEFGSECWCGNSLASSTVPPKGEYECNQTCTGSSTTSCGAGNRINVYQATLNTVVQINPSVNSYTSVSCMSDSVGSRTLANRINSIPVNSMSVSACTAACGAIGFQYAGLEYATECWCDNVINNQVSGANPVIANSFCNMPCTGSPFDYCGGGNAVLVYQNTAKQIKTLPSYTSVAPATVYTYTYSGCFADPAGTGNSRLLATPLVTTTNTVQACLQAAAVANLQYAGVEYGGECWGSNTAITATALANTACSMPCRDDPLRFCGNGWTLSVYSKP